MTTEQPGRVPVGELRELVKTYRDNAERAMHAPQERGMNMCADWLEEVIARYE